MKLLNLLALAPLALATPYPNPGAKAAYYLDSDPAGASVVALKIGNDGTLSNPVRTSTGGKGLIGNNAMGPVQRDPIFSQDAVKVSGNKLFTVNSGSNTLAAFRIRANDPQHPVLIGQPVSTGGDVPNSVAFSARHNLACVANTGTKSGVQCFTVSDHASPKPAGSFQPITLTPAQTIPPVGPTNTVSDIVFSPRENFLVATVKGDGKNPGFIYVWKVHHDGRVDKPVVSQPKDLLVNFGLSFVSHRRAVITDPSHGAAFVTIHDDGTVTVDSNITVPNQAAICWSAYSDLTDTVFLLDAGAPSIATVNSRTAQMGTPITVQNSTMGSFDGAVAGKHLYVLEATPGVSVYDITAKPPKAIQNLDLTSLGSRAGWIGMAVY